MNTFATRPLFGLACSFALPLFAAVACSSSSSNDDVSADQAATDASSALCEALQKCAPLLVQITYGDVDACKSRSKVGFQPALSANGTSLTASQLESCAQDLGGATCEKLVGHDLPASCQTKPGTLTDGAACGTDQQCQNRLCRKDATAACGTCSKLGAAGDACTANEECDYGLGCTSGVCSAFVTAGNPCDTNHACNPTLVCKSGTCGTPGEAGEACEPPTSLASTCNLVEGLFCGANRICAQLQYAGPGEPCGLVDGRGVGCSGAGTCRTTGGLSGTCQAPAADGSACSATGPSCTSPARCVGNVCKIDDPTACK